MQKQRKGRQPTKSTRFQVKPVTGGLLASIVLEELSRSYPQHCNYLLAAELARKGDLYLALSAVKDTNEHYAVTCALSTWVHAQAVAVLKKLYDPGVDRWGPTAEGWFSTERRMHRMNQKFEALTNRRSRGSKVIPYKRELYRFYEALNFALGDLDEDAVLRHSHYGPGSTVNVRGTNVNYVRKTESNECVPLAVELAARSLVFDKAVWEQHGMRPEYTHLSEAREGFIRVIREELRRSVVTTDRLMFIHKSIETLRSIGAQPTVSGMLQLGVHSVGADLLEGINIFLSDQSWNRVLARKGSLNHSESNPFCTLDKSNASNTLALGLVQYLFPPAWAKLLCKIRTPKYEAPIELGGGVHSYGMYAGMGNGTTFFVETLVFWAATYATQDLPVEEYVKRREYAVYGDDVILRKDHASRYIPFIEWLGFRLNLDKSFTSGPFRESCGADFYDGVDTRPAYLTCEGKNLAWSDIIGFHNTLADQPNFQLPNALRRIRGIWKERVFPITPTDPAGDLGFRPQDGAGYDVVKGKDGLPLISPIWHRPRYFVLDKKAKLGDLGEINAYTQIAVALMKARQDGVSTSLWSLPIRGLETERIRAEVDLERKPLVTMLRNQLSRLAVRKGQPWWNDYRGMTK